ncbi:hypothetical protein [Chryseobacterium indoltheticum]
MKIIPEKNLENIEKNVKVNTVMAKAYNATTKKLDEVYFLTGNSKIHD